jgi:uncharacterized membrane protein (DUF485 family)
MAGLDHGPAMPAEDEDGRTIARNTHYGIVLFLIYLVLYVAFVLAIAFAPATMDAAPWSGINVAVLSGFGLIGAALVMALLYGWLCRSAADGGKGSK